MVLSSLDTPSVSVGDTVRVKTQNQNISGEITRITEEDSQKKYDLRSRKGKTYTIRTDITQVELVDTNETITDFVRIS
jgi:hypothetical protein